MIQLTRPLLVTLAGVMTICLSLVASAAPPSQIEFTIENLTNAISFRPFLVAAHPEGEPVFRTGHPASDFPGVQGMAECGGLSGLTDRMDSIGADYVANPVNEAKPFDPPLGLLFPSGIEDGETAVPFATGLSGSVSGTLNATGKSNTHLSVVAMLLPTNDAFAGLDSIEIPTKPGTYEFWLAAYDAGTEGNSEIPADDNPLDCMINEMGYPVDPLGNDDTGSAGTMRPDINDHIHVHRGNVGDTDEGGGISDLDSRVHRWLNPVVKLTLHVKPGKK